MAYFMISVDDPETNRQFAESLDSGFPLLSNPTREVAEAYGVVPAGRRSFPSRWTFIIGGDGRILRSTNGSTHRRGRDLVAHHAGSRARLVVRHVITFG